MNENKWEEIKNLIKNKFELEKEEGVKDKKKNIERLIFNGPLGKMKLEWINKPKVVDIKTSGSAKRGGATAKKIEKIYSKDENVSYIKAFTDKDGHWVEIEAEDILG